MPKKVRFCGFVLLPIILVMVFFAGPRVEIDSRLRPLEIPADVQRYLTESEAAFDDIISGAEKRIVWADESRTRTPLSIVYLHGFSATRQETAPLSEWVGSALGANLFYTRLSGHGRNGAAMLQGSVNAWLNDAQEAVVIGSRLGEKIIIISVSTGATIATWLATHAFSEKVAAFIMLSPNYGPADRQARLLLWPWGGALAELIVGDEYYWQAYNELHERYWMHRYPSRALMPMMGMVSLVESLDLAKIEKPVLMIYSPQDRVVDTHAIETVFDKIGSTDKRLFPFTGAEDPFQHVLAGDILSPNSTRRIADIIIDFIAAYIQENQTR